MLRELCKDPLHQIRHQRRKTHHAGGGVLCDISNTISTTMSINNMHRQTEWYYKVDEVRKDGHDHDKDEEEMVDMEIDSNATTCTPSSSIDHYYPEEFDDEEMIMLQNDRSSSYGSGSSSRNNNSSNEEEEEDERRVEQPRQQQKDVFHSDNMTLTTITMYDNTLTEEEILAKEFLIHLRSKENLYHIGFDYFKASIQPHLNAKMRSVLVDWLIEVHFRLKLQTETLFLALNYVDRFLSKVSIPIVHHQLQLIGVTGLFVASKFEEIYPIEMDDLVYLGDRAYTSQQILHCEKEMLTILEFHLMAPTVWNFISHMIKYTTINSNCLFQEKKVKDQKKIEEIERMANFYAHYTVLDFHLYHTYQPSLLAATCILFAFGGGTTETETEIEIEIEETHKNKKQRLDNKNTTFHMENIRMKKNTSSILINLFVEKTGFDCMDLIPCVRDLCQVLSTISSSCSNKLLAIQTKFTSKKYGRIAKRIPMPPLQMTQWLEEQFEL
jgi:hypothetical protein